MNRPAGQAKTREKKRPPRKPYVERDDGKNAERLGEALRSIFSMPHAVAKAIRKSRA